MPTEMNALRKQNRILFWAGFGLSAICVGVLAVQLLILARPQPMRIKLLHKEIKSLQERLISAQITSQNLDEVQKLIHRNLAMSSSDDMAQGASMNFLLDLHRVLDNLQITVVHLQPKAIKPKGDFIETPYDLEIVCDFRRFCQLAAKMEKSPRLISITHFEIDNSIEDYLTTQAATSGWRSEGQCRVRMQISTLTLVRRS
jgi:Tfp pilus assembly protein PilO